MEQENPATEFSDSDQIKASDSGHENNESDQPDPIYEDTKFCCWKISKELVSWIVYDMASSGIGGFGLVVLLPLFMGLIAREKAYEGEDGINYCDKGANCFLPAGADFSGGVCEDSSGVALVETCRTCIAQAGGTIVYNVPGSPGFSSENKQIPFLWTTINFQSLYPTVLAISVAMQFFFFATFGPFADHGSWRKRLMYGSAMTGAFCSLMFFFISEDFVSDPYIWGSFLVIFLNVLYGYSTVCYNAYLPVLANAHPKVCLLPEDCTEEDKAEAMKIYAQHEAQISNAGFTWGYVGQLAVMIVCLSLIVFIEEHMAYRSSMAILGFWWGLIMIPGLIYLKQRPGPPFPISSTNCFGVLFFGWARMAKAIMLACKYKHLLLVLLSYFLASDALGTVQMLGVVFAQNELCMDQIWLVILVVLNLIAAIIGGIFFGVMKKLFKITAKMIIMCTLVVFIFCHSYGIVGIFSNQFGLRSKNELIVFACVIGFCNGIQQSMYRALFSDLVIIGWEAAFFCLYAVTDKCSSFGGPTVVASLMSSPDVSTRWIFVYLLIETILAAILLFFADPLQGMIESGRATSPKIIPKLADEEQLIKTREDNNTI